MNYWSTYVFVMFWTHLLSWYLNAYIVCLSGVDETDHPAHSQGGLVRGVRFVKSMWELESVRL